MTGQGSPASSSYNAAVALEFFRSAGKPKTFAKGRKIFAENQRGFPFLLMPNRMYLLLDGEVAVFAKNTPIGTVRPGQIFGEMASIDQGPRSATAVAKSACRVIALDRRQLQTALARRGARSTSAISPNTLPGPTASTRLPPTRIATRPRRTTYISTPARPSVRIVFPAS